MKTLDMLKKEAIQAFDKRTDVDLSVLIDVVSSLDGEEKEAAVKAMEHGALFNAVDFVFNIIEEKTPFVPSSIMKLITPFLRNFVTKYLQKKFG